MLLTMYKQAEVSKSQYICPRYGSGRGKPVLAAQGWKLEVSRTQLTARQGLQWLPMIRYISGA
jgi:hypothetical protein